MAGWVRMSGGAFGSADLNTGFRNHRDVTGEKRHSNIRLAMESILFGAVPRICRCAVTSVFQSTEPAGNIVLRLPFAWICENFRGRPKLDQPPKIKESSVIGDAASLLHVVGHGHNRVLRFEFVD